jgi:hypothetical protein
VVVGLRCLDRPRVVGLRWVWVFAEAHKLEDLFMEPWVEATCGGGGGGEIWVCSSRSRFFFFFFFLFNSLVLELWNLTLFGC